MTQQFSFSVYQVDRENLEVLKKKMGVKCAAQVIRRLIADAAAKARAEANANA